MARLNEHGHEILDPQPVARPLNWNAPEPLESMIRRYIRTELSRHAADEGHETFEEADDFDVDDDFDPTSPWELNYDQES